MAAYTNFRPPHLLPAPTPASGPGAEEPQGRSGEGRVLRRRTRWRTLHPLGLLTPRVLGPGTIAPEPQRCEHGVLGAALRRQGQESELESGLRQISEGGLWSASPGWSSFRQGHRPLTALCQSEPGWVLQATGPATAQTSPPATKY